MMRGAWEPEGAKAVAEVARRAAHGGELPEVEEEGKENVRKMREEQDVLGSTRCVRKR